MTAPLSPSPDTEPVRRGADRAMSTAALLLSPLCRPGDPIMVRSSVQASGGCRWTLRYTWDDALPVLPWLMLNPAEAGTGRAYDLTARRVIRFSHRWGFGGALLLNVVPCITADPREARVWLEKAIEGGAWDQRDHLWANWRILQRQLAPFDACLVAWGCSLRAGGTMASYTFDDLLEEVFDTINAPDGTRTRILETWCLGTSASGDPLHPMARGRSRVPDDRAPVPWTGRPGTIVGLGLEEIDLTGEAARADRP